MCNWNTCNNKNCFIGDTMSELQEMAREILNIIIGVVDTKKVQLLN